MGHIKTGPVSNLFLWLFISFIIFITIVYLHLYTHTHTHTHTHTFFKSKEFQSVQSRDYLRLWHHILYIYLFKIIYNNLYYFYSCNRACFIEIEFISVWFFFLYSGKSFFGKTEALPFGKTKQANNFIKDKRGGGPVFPIMLF